MSNLVQEKFEVVLSAGNGGNGAIKPFSTLNWGIFLLSTTWMHNYAKLYIFVVTNLCDMLECCWTPNVGTNIGSRNLCFRGAFTFYTLHKRPTKKSITLIHLLWGSCEIPVFILPIKTILSELFCLGQALDCEWRDLKLETNFVLGNFYYLWKNSYIWILESVIQNKLLLCSLTFFSFQTTSVIL